MFSTSSDLWFFWSVDGQTCYGRRHYPFTAPRGCTLHGTHPFAYWGDTPARAPSGSPMPPVVFSLNSSTVWQRLRCCLYVCTRYTHYTRAPTHARAPIRTGRPRGLGPAAFFALDYYLTAITGARAGTHLCPAAACLPPLGRTLFAAVALADLRDPPALQPR